MIKTYIKFALLLVVIMSSMANAAYQLSSRGGTASGNTIIGTEVQLSYQTDAGTTWTATNNASVTTVSAIYGYDPSWASIPTKGIEPGETSTYSYQFKNVGNDADQFNVTFSAVYFASDSSSWNVTISATSFILSPDQASSVFDLVITSSSLVTPGAYVAVSVNIECLSSLNVVNYTGDNGYVYGGFGDAAQVVTTTVMLAVLNITKTVTVNAPAGYIANGGGAHDAVPGALLTYDINWSNTGSQFARNVQIIDLIPTLSATLTSNITLTSLQAMTTTRSYYVLNSWTTTPSNNATQLKIEYASIPAGVTGNIRYNLIIK